VVSSGSAAISRLSGALRVLAATAILASVAFAVGLQCADGMMPAVAALAGPAPHDSYLAASAMPRRPLDTGLGKMAADAADTSLIADSPHHSGGSAIGALAGAEQPGGMGGGFGGMVGACLSLILVALVAIAVALGRARGWRCAITSPMAVIASRAAIPSGPQLSRLCVLRT
jgi:hypothetical protein